MKKRILLPILMMFSVILSIAQTQTIASGNWSNPAIWSSGVPSATTSAIVNHAVTVDVDASVLSLDVSGTGSITNSKQDLEVWGDLTVASPSAWIESNVGKTVMRGTSSTINGKIYFNRLRIWKNKNSNTTTATDTLFIKAYFYLFRGKLDVGSNAVVLLANATSEANLGYSPYGTLLGTIIWQKYINRCNEWSTYSVPFSATFDQIASSSNGRMVYTGFSGGLDYPTTTFVNTYFYNESSGYQVPSSTGSTVSRDAGYWYWNSDQVFNSSQGSIPQQWLIQLSQNGMNSGNFNFNLSFSTDGFNLVGNPYPGVLNWNTSGWTKTNIEDAIYYWNTCTQSYASYVNGVGTNGGDQWIPSGQGFFVQANATNPALSCNTSLLSLGTLPAKPLKSGENYVDVDENEEEYPVVKMMLNGDETVFRFTEEATFGFDNGKDARKVIPPSFLPNNSHLLTRLGNFAYSINALPLEDQIIPLEVRGQGELSFNGANEFSDLDIYLEDLVTGDIVDMKLFNFYNFTNIEKDFTHRFNIIVKASQQLSVTEQSANDKLSVYPNPFNNEVNVMSNGVSFDRVDIYNVLGEMVMTEVSNVPSKTINVSKLNSGMYFIKVYNNNQEIGVYMTQKM